MKGVLSTSVAVIQAEGGQRKIAKRIGDHRPPVFPGILLDVPARADALLDVERPCPAFVAAPQQSRDAAGRRIVVVEIVAAAFVDLVHRGSA